jgi:SAM-dependent methyltransferase
MALTLPANAFDRLDDSADDLFYAFPRFTVHIDDRAVRTFKQIFAEHLPKEGTLLDLMSSWRSHLPDRLSAHVVGLGLNREEMADNPALHEIVVHDLNRETRLPFADQTFAAVVVTVSIQYMVKPVEVFAEVGRVLRDHGPFIVAFSNRMFPTKAVRIWRESSEPRRLELVRSYFELAGVFDRLAVVDRSAETRGFADPVYAVIGHRRARG